MDECTAGSLLFAVEKAERRQKNLPYTKCIKIRCRQGISFSAITLVSSPKKWYTIV